MKSLIEGQSGFCIKGSCLMWILCSASLLTIDSQTHERFSWFMVSYGVKEFVLLQIPATLILPCCSHFQYVRSLLARH